MGYLEDQKQDAITIGFSYPSDGTGTVGAEFYVDAKEFTSITFSQEYLAPIDQFSFVVGGRRAEHLFQTIRAGAIVRIYVGSVLQMTGAVDNFSVVTNRSNGTVLTVSGRDLLSRLADSVILDDIKITEKDSLKVAVEKVVTNYGFKGVIAPASADENLIKGSNRDNYRAKNFTKKGKATRSLETFLIQQQRPRPTEGAFEFVMRLVKRHGFTLYCSRDGKYVIIGDPTFDAPNAETKQTIIYDPKNLENIYTGYSEVVDAKQTFDFEHQPSIIVSGATGGGGVHRKATMHCLVVNELVTYKKDTDVEVAKGGDPLSVMKSVLRDDVYAKVERYKKIYPGIVIMPLRDELSKVPYKGTDNRNFFPKVLEDFDEDSSNGDQVQKFARRKMAEYQSHFLQVHLKLRGVIDTNTKTPWNINSMVHVVHKSVYGRYVNDEEPGISEIDHYLWVKGKSVTVSRQGTFTDLTLILPYTLEL